jgi:hypothetical protein
VPISLYPNFIKALAMVKLAPRERTPMSARCPARS